MAQLTFVGAAGTVTGSKHLVTTGSHRFFVDCGLFQGNADTRELNDEPLPLAPADVEAVIVTHGHIDHVGYLPKLVKDGFRGKIYCTPPTQDLIEIVLEDAAHLQAHLAQRGAAREGPHVPPPYYDAGDVADTLRLIQPVPLHTDFSVCDATVRYKNAGHIIGSAFVEMNVEGRQVVFSGDLGRYGRPLLYNPEDLERADVVVCETTYGDRIHPPDPLGDLKAALLAGVARGGPIVIPAFAVERTQDLLLSIGMLQKAEPSLAGLPVHVDSPMAIKVDRLFAKYPDAHRPISDTPQAPFGCSNVTLHVTTDESKALNGLRGPAVIISSSGMASGGRILHHLHTHIPNPAATILFVGFQGPGTLGNLLVHGAKSVRIYGDTLAVAANVVNLAGYSAHADQSELLRWLGTLQNVPALYAVHGEAASAAAFCSVAHAKLGFAASAGERGSTIAL